MSGTKNVLGSGICDLFSPKTEYICFDYFMQLNYVETVIDGFTNIGEYEISALIYEFNLKMLSIFGKIKLKVV